MTAGFLYIAALNCVRFRTVRFFQSYADFLVAVEWNQDINHYGNIIKSLARDMHCYCIQVNEAKYGDSRIVIPTRTEERDLARNQGWEKRIDSGG